LGRSLATSGGRTTCLRGKKKGLGFCHPEQTEETGKGADRGGEGFVLTCTRRCRRSTSRSTGSDPCPPTLLDQLPYRKIPRFSANHLPDRTGTNTNPRFTEGRFAESRRIRETEGVGGGEKRGGAARSTLERMRFSRRNAWQESPRGEERVVEETVWGAMGRDGERIYLNGSKGRAGTRPSVRRWTGEMGRGG
jgi:hypothetical protein